MTEQNTVIDMPQPQSVALSETLRKMLIESNNHLMRAAKKAPQLRSLLAAQLQLLKHPLVDSAPTKHALDEMIETDAQSIEQIETGFMFELDKVRAALGEVDLHHDFSAAGSQLRADLVRTSQLHASMSALIWSKYLSK